MENELKVEFVSWTLATRIADAWRVLRGKSYVLCGKNQLGFYSPNGLRVEAPEGEYPGALAALVIYPNA